MKGLKVKSGTLLFLVLLLIIPKGYSATPINATVFLIPGQMSPIYTIQVSKGEVVKWSFQTYNDSFNVGAIGLGVGTVVSSGHMADSGSVEALVTGSIMFYFTNMGSNSGYIDISIRIQEDTIEGYPYTIFIVILISIVSVISIKLKQMRRKMGNGEARRS